MLEKTGLASRIPASASRTQNWLGQQDSNLHSWYQKPESYHWTMAQYFNSSECTTLPTALTMNICKAIRIHKVIHKSPTIIAIREGEIKDSFTKLTASTALSASLRQILHGNQIRLYIPNHIDMPIQCSVSSQPRYDRDEIALYPTIPHLPIQAPHRNYQAVLDAPIPPHPHLQ